MGRSLAILGTALALAPLAGCGSGSESPPTEGAGPTPAGVEAAREALEARRAAAREAPRGASPTLRAIYAGFPPPRPDPRARRRSARAIGAGIAACAGKTPLDVKERFLATAREGLTPEQLKLIGRIAELERSSSKDPGFTAGQLAADVYEATLPEAVRQYGYRGCVYALARGLEHRLQQD